MVHMEGLERMVIVNIILIEPIVKIYDIEEELHFHLKENSMSLMNGILYIKQVLDLQINIKVIVDRFIIIHTV
jgi:hypothetical protein